MGRAPRSAPSPPASAAPSPPAAAARWAPRTAALGGALAVILAFPTIGWSPAVFLAWPPLLWFAPRLPWRRRLRLGWLLGFVYQLVLFRWVTFTLEEMSGQPAWVGWGATALFAAWHGLLGGVFLALAEPARRTAEARLRGTGPLAVAAVYTALEWVFPFLFPWALGHALWRVGPLASLMALTGPPGLSFVVVALGAAAVDAARGATRRLVWRPLWVTALAVVPLLAFAVGWYLHIHGTSPRRTLRVAILQPNWTLAEKKHMTPARRVALLKRLDAQLRALPAGRYDLVVASEGAFPLFWRLDADTWRAAGPGHRVPLNVAATRAVEAAVREGPHADAVLGGLRGTGAGGRLHNSAVLITADGRLGGSYDKRVLVPFGEYVPGRDLFPSLAGSIPGVGDLGAGETPCHFRAAGEPVSCGICYEALFSSATREGLGDASVLLNLTIDTWFGRSTAPWFHLMAQSSRAAELGVPLLRAALTGISAAVGPDGVPLATLPLGQQGVLSVDVPLRDLRPPFRRVGPVFGWLMLAPTALLLGVAWRRRPRAGPVT